MNRLPFLLTAGLLLFSLQVLGQNTSSKAIEQAYIEVTGTAEKEVVPDEIYIGIILREKYVNKNKISIEEQEDQLKKAITSLGLNLSDLYLSDANADYVKIRWKKKDVLTKKDYTLKVSNATTVGQVFQELEQLEITDAFISKVAHSKIDSLKKEVKIAAIKAAKEKADYLLAAIHEHTGKPLIVMEVDPLPVNNVANITLRELRYNSSGLYEDKLKSYGDHEIEFQKINIQTSIYVKFSIQ